MTRVRRALAALEDFWFAPLETSTLALVRIALGVVVLAWTLSLTGDLFSFFGANGIQPTQPRVAGAWGVLGIVPGRAAIGLLFAALLLAALGLTVGFQSRLCSVIVFIGLMSFERRSPWVFNAGDELLRILAFYLMLTPSGAALSVDRWLKGGSIREFPKRPPWGLRLIQLQLSVIYVSAVWAKAQGKTWNDGSAISYALRLTDLTRFPFPSFLSHSPFASTLMSYGTLATELSLGLFVWNRRLRPWVLALGVLMHLGIDWSLRVGFFALAMFVMYVAFVPPERASEWIRAVGRRLAASLAGSRAQRSRVPALADTGERAASGPAPADGAPQPGSHALTQGAAPPARDDATR